MKYINSFQINKSTINSAANQITITVRGDVDSVFSLQIKDSSTPNKFFNFKTNVTGPGQYFLYNFKNSSLIIQSLLSIFKLQ